MWIERLFIDREQPSLPFLVEYTLKLESGDSHNFLLKLGCTDESIRSEDCSCA